MEALIREKLKEIERQENIRILYAVESGSRAWGFPSRDSDYDVRFLYVRPLEYYLKLEKTRDVIELPINDLLDINGWDLNKTLQLLHSSNPTLFEWMSSPIVYWQTPFADSLRDMMGSYFFDQKSLYHYLAMAQRNYQEFLRGDMVKAKKYFYVLRPVLACRWILGRQTPPPMAFQDLVESQLDPHLRPEVQHLLDIKMNVPELKLIPRVETINRYLEESFEEIRVQATRLPRKESPGWEPLEGLFRQVVLEKI